MVAKKITPEVAAKLNVLAGLHAERMAFKDTRKRELMLQLDEEMGARLDAESRLANELLSIGATNEAVKLAVGIGNWNTYQALLHRTKDELDPQKKTPFWEVEEQAPTWNFTQFDHIPGTGLDHNGKERDISAVLFRIDGGTEYRWRVAEPVWKGSEWDDYTIDMPPQAREAYGLSEERLDEFHAALKAKLAEIKEEK